jgi:hypothetical protein
MALFCASYAHAALIVADGWRDGAHLISSFDGSIIQLDFISDLVSGPDLSVPIEAMQVGNEIWMTDQNLDAVLRYDMSGTYISNFVGPGDQLDNVRGFHVADNVLYVTNFGTNNGAPGGAIRKFDATTGANLGTVVYPQARSPWDVAGFGSRVLASDDFAIGTGASNTAGIIELFPDGTTSVFASGSEASNGISLIKQMISLSNGNLLAANNSLPRALIEFNSAGGIVASYPLGSLQSNGIYELENGLILIGAQGTGINGTNGLYTLDRTNGNVVPIFTGATIPGGGGTTPNFINFIIPEPGTLGLLALGIICLHRRR